MTTRRQRLRRHQPGEPRRFVHGAGRHARTLILWDSTRISGTVQAEKSRRSDEARQPSSLTAVRSAAQSSTWATPFSGKDRIALPNQHADQNPGCVYAKNLVAYGDQGHRRRLPRTSQPEDPIKYVVLVGGDATIPFFRYPDQNELGPEKDYIPPVGPDARRRPACVPTTSWARTSTAPA